jgi:hypothetical protein
MSATIIPFGRPEPPRVEAFVALAHESPAEIAARILRDALAMLEDDRLDDAETAAKVARNCIQIAISKRGSS